MNRLFPDSLLKIPPAIKTEDTTSCIEVSSVKCKILNNLVYSIYIFLLTTTLLLYLSLYITFTISDTFSLATFLE